MRMEKGGTDNEDLDVLQEALERACQALDIQREDPIQSEARCLPCRRIDPRRYL